MNHLSHFLAHKRSIFALSLSILLLLAIPLLVLADQITNNLDAIVDATPEILALNYPGSPASVTFYINPANGDGRNGCNITSGTNFGALTVNFASNNESVATVFPNSYTFTDCGMPSGVSVSITPVGLGSATISASGPAQLGSGGAARTFTYGESNFTVNVTAPPNSAPSISVVGVMATTYEIGSVPAASCQVTDAEDGNSTFPAILGTISGPNDAYGLGNQTASCSYTDGGGLTASASVTYEIVDSIAPVITYVSQTPANGNSWNNSDVTVNWSCSDSGSGVVAANVSVTVSSEGAGQSATGTCTDHVGNSASATVSGINIDKTAPSISGSASPAANGNGWNNSDVTVSFSCADALSGIASCGPDQTLSGEGAGQSVDGTAVDNAGNTATTSVGGINIDKTAPSVSASALPAANGDGWNNSTVTVSYSGADSLSGIDSCDPATVLSSEGAGQSASGSCTDLAGNSALATASGINIDKTAPSITWNGGPAADGVYYFSFVPAMPTCSAIDTLSGPGGCTISGYSTAIGSHTMTATALDLAGNSKVETRSYTVNAWRLSGFYNPVDMGGVVNTVKSGSTVPLKFEVFAGTLELTSTSIVVQPLRATQVACTGGSEDSIEMLSSGSTVLRYDETAGQFIYNWQTPKGKAGFCYAVTVGTQDGSALVAYFKLK